MRAIAAALLPFIVLGTLIAGTVPTYAGGVSQCIRISSPQKPLRFSSSSTPAATMSRKEKAAAQKAARLARRKGRSTFRSASSAAPSIDVGIVVHKNGGALYISSLTPGGAADQAGFLLGDEIRKLDGKDAYKKYSPEALMKALNGPEGSSVTLEIARQKDGGILSITLVKKKAVEKAEYALQMTDGLLLLKIEAFNGATSKPLREALGAVQWKDVKGVAVDLRTPPTGTLTGMDPIISAFLPKGTPFATLQFTNARKETMVTGADPLVPATLPLFVLLPSSGSFSEGAVLLAHNLEEKRNATLLREEKGVGSQHAYLSFGDMPAGLEAFCADRIDVNLYNVGARSIAVTPVPGMDSAVEKAKFFIQYPPR